MQLDEYPTGSFRGRLTDKYPWGNCAIYFVELYDKVQASGQGTPKKLLLKWIH